MNAFVSVCTSATIRQNGLLWKRSKKLVTFSGHLAAILKLRKRHFALAKKFKFNSDLCECFVFIFLVVSLHTFRFNLINYVYFDWIYIDFLNKSNHRCLTSSRNYFLSRLFGSFPQKKLIESNYFFNNTTNKAYKNYFHYKDLIDVSFERFINESCSTTAKTDIDTNYISNRQKNTINSKSKLSRRRKRTPEPIARWKNKTEPEKSRKMSLKTAEWPTLMGGRVAAAGAGHFFRASKPPFVGLGGRVPQGVVKLDLSMCWGGGGRLCVCRVSIRRPTVDDHALVGDFPGLFLLFLCPNFVFVESSNFVLLVFWISRTNLSFL